MNKKIIIVIILLLLSMLICSCSVIETVVYGNDEDEVEVTATPTPTPTPMPTPTPTPTPTVEPEETEEPIEVEVPKEERDPGPYGDGQYVIEEYDNEYPESVPIDLKYDEYEFNMNYVVFKQNTGVFEDRDVNSANVKYINRGSDGYLSNEFYYGERVEVTAKLEGIDNGYEDPVNWYRLNIIKPKYEEEVIGYANASICSRRTFQLEKAYNEVVELAEEINADDTFYVNVANRSNDNGVAPDTGLKNDFEKVVDEFGVLQDQSVPAYYEQNKDGKFRYIPDGTLVKVLEVSSNLEDLSEVYIPQYDKNFFVPRKYLNFKNSEKLSTIETLTQCIVVDRYNLNEMYFEVDEDSGQWELVSTNYVSTGAETVHADPTPLGYFGVLKIKDLFEYPSDTNSRLEDGYAPYVLRFSGGAYIHGVPVKYTYNADGTRESGRETESHPSLGVKPESHMCVRNYTSHAEFLYKRIRFGESAVIVME